VQRWRLNQTASAPLLTPSAEGIQSIAYSPKGNLIAAGGQDKQLRLWQKNGKLVRSIAAHDTPIQKVAFSRDESMVATSGVDGTVKLWQVSTGKLLTALVAHQGDVGAIAFSDKMIATGSSDRTIKLWRFDGRLIRTLSGHEDNVLSLAFNPDGNLLASASLDKTVKLWKTEGNLLATLSAHIEGVRSVAFHPDGGLLASASNDNTVILWNLNQVLQTDPEIAACGWLQEYLATNSALSESDRTLCQGVDRTKLYR
jgi:WD40 repeat protein